jgi:hypothetical protein
LESDAALAFATRAMAFIRSFCDGCDLQYQVNKRAPRVCFDRVVARTFSDWGGAPPAAMVRLSNCHPSC